VIISDHFNNSYRPFLNGKYSYFINCQNIAPVIDDLFRTKDKNNYIYQADQSHDRELVELARLSAKECGIELMDGCYAFWPLPSFETPADI
jgi:purine nucleoside phosphorylase